MKFYVAATSGMFLYCVAVLLGEIEIFSTFFLQSDFLMGALLPAKWGACQGAYRGLLGGNFGAIVSFYLIFPNKIHINCVAGRR